MTPEERLTRIEIVIEKQNVQIEKNTAGIRDLIVVARTCLDSIQELRDVQREDHQLLLENHQRVMAEIDKLREAQAATDEKLNILIDTVDRIIRRNGKEPQE
jgi:hypothetical protein